METAVLRAKEIHSAVDNASAVLLQDMPYNLEQAEALRGMGFGKSENVRDVDDHMANRKMAAYYRQKYPHYKFITDYQLEKIRKTYNLIEGELGAFKGDIPAKNVKEMMAFAIMSDDIEIYGKSPLSDAMDALEMALGSNMMIPSILQNFKYQESMSSRAQERDLFKVRMRSLSPRDFERELMNYPNGGFDREPVLQQVRGNIKLSFSEITKTFKSNVKITADRELFDIPDRRLDPIVTVGVKGGRLIVTAWGPEASDPDIVNQAMN